MAGMDILKSAGQSLTGAVTKAYLQFEDERLTAKEVQVTQVAAREAQKAGVGGAFGNLAKKAGEVVESAQNAAEAIGEMANSAVAPAAKRKYEVKFNPKEITIQARGGNGELIQKMNYAAEGKVSAKFSEMRTSIMMNVPLIFDDMERTDAFMFEKLTDPLALTRTAVTSIVNDGMGKSYSVRPQVEGFIGALHDEKTRKITLCWGKMAYKGILNAVDAEYTMFNMSGNPIRAVVNLRIILVDSTVKDNNMGIWQESYKEIFKDDYSVGSYTSFGGNLLNVNL